MKTRLCDSCGSDEGYPYLIQMRGYIDGKLAGVIKSVSIDLCEADSFIFASDLQDFVDDFKEWGNEDD